MPEELHCYRCGASIAALTLPLGRADECPSCRTEVRVCRMCFYFDRAAVKQCREDDAEEVKEKTRSNYCEYFKPDPHAGDSSLKSAEDAARGVADDLFK